VYWTRASIRDGLASKAVFWRYLCCFDRIWNVISPLNSTNFSTSWREFLEPSFSSLFSTHLGLLIFDGVETAESAHLRSVYLPLVPLVCSKTFPVWLCAGYRKSRHFFGSDSAIVTFLPEFFLFYVFATEIAQGRCMYTTGVAVHFSAFRLLGYAFAPSFLAIFTFLVRFGKMNFIVEFNKFFYVRYDLWNKFPEPRKFFWFGFLIWACWSVGF